MSNPKPKLLDYGNAAQVFADDLCRIDQFGAVTHLIFATTSRDGIEGVARRVELRLIVPTDNIAAMGRAMLGGHVEAEGADSNRLHS